MKGFSTPTGRPLAIAVVAYAAVVICLWLAVDVLADRAWPATILAFGPRWPAALPLFPLALLVVVVTTGRMARRLIVLVAVTGLVLVFGFMDYRLGLGRVAATPVLRIMTHNLGGSRVTGDALDRFMTAERIDIAALQECGFYNNDMAHLDWHFYYGGNLCLVSRYPFTLPDVRDPDNALEERLRSRSVRDRNPDGTPAVAECAPRNDPRRLGGARPATSGAGYRSSPEQPRRVGARISRCS